MNKFICKLSRNPIRIGNAFRFSATTTTPIETTELESINKRAKHKVPQKRASKLIGILRQEEVEMLKKGKTAVPQIRAGDSISIEKYPYKTSEETDIIKGVVIGVRNKLADSALELLNVEYGTPVRRKILIHSPLVKEIKILQRAFIHKGKKRVRRSKLYYLIDRHPDEYTVK